MKRRSFLQLLGLSTIAPAAIASLPEKRVKGEITFAEFNKIKAAIERNALPVEDLEIKIDQTYLEQFHKEIIKLSKVQGESKLRGRLVHPPMLKK